MNEGPEAREFVRIGMQKTTFPLGVDEAKEQFGRWNALHLRGLMDEAFFKTVMRLSGEAEYVPGAPKVEGYDVPGFREVEASPQKTGRILNMALSRPEMLRWLEEVTGCGPLKDLGGRIAQTLVREGDELRWHDDLHHEEKRRLAMVVNLSTETYEGGEFDLRWKTGEEIFRHRYAELNTALLFKVSGKLEHRVMHLKSGGPRRVFAGWAFGAGAAR